MNTLKHVGQEKQINENNSYTYHILPSHIAQKEEFNEYESKPWFVANGDVNRRDKKTKPWFSPKQHNTTVGKHPKHRTQDTKETCERLK